MITRRDRTRYAQAKGRSVSSYSYFDVPIISGPHDGMLMRVDELQPSLYLVIQPNTPIEQPNGGIARDAAFQKASYRLETIVIPMLDVDWIYPFYLWVHAQKKSVLWFLKRYGSKWDNSFVQREIHEGEFGAYKADLWHVKEGWCRID